MGAEEEDEEAEHDDERHEVDGPLRGRRRPDGGRLLRLGLQVLRPLLVREDGERRGAHRPLHSLDSRLYLHAAREGKLYARIGTCTLADTHRVPVLLMATEFRDSTTTVSNFSYASLNLTCWL